MNSRKILAGLSAAVLSMTLLPLSAFAEDTADSSDSLTLPECIDRINEMNRIDELNAPDVGIYATPISEEEGEIIQRVLENDYANADGNEYVYKYQKYDFSSDYN